ncbi:MAG: cardiolipin synthase [Clostridia bacterium]|nr:cardiolipin synthase [Clostridia bacterium]
MNKKWLRKLFKQRILIGLLIALQLTFMIYLLLSSGSTSAVIAGVLKFLSLVVSLYIFSRKDKGAYKLTWVFLILLFPLFGGLFYLMFSFQSTFRASAKRMDAVSKRTAHYFSLPETQLEEARARITSASSALSYMQNFAGFPVYNADTTLYLSPGEQMLEKLCAELEKAEKYIFLEYFIIQEGKMWDTILEILRRKAAAGVKVRLIYDDMGCFFLLPKNYPEKLKKYGIECVVFNPFRPVLSVIQNNRDHRKIAVIDGKVAFTGGINLADEYINAIEKHGHWKDSAVMVTGNAAWGLTVIFLQMWELCSGLSEDYSAYFPGNQLSNNDSGYIIPYSDSPLDTENVGEHVYLQLINNARKYLYITTPYLIIDSSTVSALTLAAKSGVDVRIITPEIWDKRLVHMTTRSYYRELIDSGVKIYEYSGGFIHSKTFVSDDYTATVGTANLDFRSLYLQFECGVLMYNTTAVADIKKDFLDTLDKCRQITAEDCKCNLIKRFFQDVLRLIAPLM